MTDGHQPPPRLVQTLGPAGDCLREVLTEREQPPSPPRFALLQERRLRRVQRQRALALLAVVGALIGLRALRHQEALPEIRAELGGLRAIPELPAAADSALPTELGAQDSALPVKSSESTALTPLKSASLRSSRPAQARTNEPSPANTVITVAVDASEAAPSGGAKACAQLARDGASEQALRCYAQLASGTGMSAELALFEQARLQGKALRQPERALSTLDDYRRRFPNGSLRAEVMLAQIDWLLASGNSPRALQVVDEALASGLLRERTSELERLRAKLNASSPE